MNSKKIIALILAFSVCFSTLAACSAKNDDIVATTKKVVEVKDADDDVKVETSDDEENDTRVEIKDNQGNTLTVVPVYNSDGKTVIAGYIEKAVDKSGKELTDKEYDYIKSVIAMTVNEQGQCVITYTDDKKFITLDAQCDEKGYIVALQDSIDVDGDKNTQEYFKAVTKLDAYSNLFIKLDKDGKGNLINVEVEEDKKGNTVVVDDEGNKQISVSSKQSVNLVEISEKDKEIKKQQAASSASSSSGANTLSGTSGITGGSQNNTAAQGWGNSDSGSNSGTSSGSNSGTGSGSNSGTSSGSNSGTGSGSNSGTGSGSNSGTGSGSNSGTGSGSNSGTSSGSNSGTGSGSNSGTGSGSSSGTGSGSGTVSDPFDELPENPSNEEEIDYTSIVLLDNGKVACDADNVTVKEASALNGGSEIIVTGGGTYNKYYITSETSVFSGQIEFRLSVEDSVEVKVYNVDISTAKKTAVKFTNVDSESEKENDGEEQVGDNSQSGNELAVPVPQVEFSITGTNSFEAAGSGKNGTIYSECRLGIKGHGSATIDGGQNLSGICSTESIDIKNATLNITSEAKQGISCDKKVTVKGGATINIISKGDGIHCNKFETDPLAEGETDSVINITSFNPADGADGIDANDYIIIGSGKIDIVASLTTGKRGMKVRKVENGKVDSANPPEDTEGKPDGFYINGGTVTALGSTNSPLTKCKQKTVTAKSRKAGTFTIGSVTSSGSNKSFICSPVSVSTVTSSTSSKAKDIVWSGNIGSASF